MQNYNPYLLAIRIQLPEKKVVTTFAGMMYHRKPDTSSVRVMFKNRGLKVKVLSVDSKQVSMSHYKETVEKHRIQEGEELQGILVQDGGQYVALWGLHSSDEEEKKRPNENIIAHWHYVAV